MPKFFSMDDADSALNLTPGSNGWHTGRCPNKGHLDEKPSFGMIADPETGKLRSYCQVCPDQKSVFLAAIDKIRKHVEANCGDKDRAQVDSKGENITIDIEQQRLSRERRAKMSWDRASTDTSKVSMYFQARGLPGEVPETIRQDQLEYTPRSGAYFDTMVAAVQDLQGQVVGVHRTFLESNPDGTVVKANVESPKKALGSIKGNSVHLYDADEQIDIKAWHLVEGIETGRRLKEALPTAVVCAVLSAKNLATVQIPATVEKLYIWADLDRSGTGEDWAGKAAKHFSSLGVQVFVMVPPGPIPEGKKGIDWLESCPEAIVAAYENATEFVVNEPWDNWSLPSGYTMNNQGVFLEKIKSDGTVQQVMVATGAAWLSGKKINLTSRETELEISWYVSDRSMVSSRWVNRGQLFKRTTLLEMAEIEAFPVFDSIAGETTRYLALFERANKLPTTLIVRKPGWTQNAVNKWIYITGQDDQDVEFHPEAAYRSYAAALKSKGTFSNWLNAIRPLATKFPVVLFAILASLAAPLLRLLDAANFVVDFWGPTSKGKTTLLQIIASAWGKPSKPGGLIFSWNNTAIFSERLATFFGGGGPMFFDDSQTAQEKVIESIVYMIANGSGRGRAKPYSIKEVDSFQVTLFATGEKPLTEYSFPGAKARVIEINGTPFPGIDPGDVPKFKSVIMQNYGFLGVQYISTLMQWEEQDLRDEYEVYLQHYMALASNEIGYRFAAYFATIRLAAKIITTIPEMQWVEPLVDGALDEIWHSTTVDMDDTDMATKALRGIAAWIESNKSRFATSKTSAFIDPIYGIIKKEEGYVAIMPHVFKRALMELGIQSYAAVLEEWKKRGWLHHAPGRNQKQEWL